MIGIYMDRIEQTSVRFSGMDFYGLKVGGTPLRDVPQLSGRYGCRVLLKDESVNEASGTFKDRRNAALLLEDRNVPDKRWYIHITSGNQGFSLGRLCSVYNKEEGYASGRERQVLNVVDRRVPDSIKRTLSGFGRIYEVDLRRTHIPNNVLEEIGRQVIGDSSATYKAVEEIGDLGDSGSLAAELYPEHADYWSVPVGEGELMTKLALEVHGKTDMPKIIGATINDNVFATRKEFHRRARMSPADKLVAAYSDFKEMLELLCNQDGHCIETVSDRRIMREFEYLKGLQIRSEPSATAAFAGAQKYIERNGLGVNDKVIIINTGYGLYEPVTMLPQLAMKTAAAILAASALFGAVSYVSDRVSDIKQAQRIAKSDEATQMEILKNQREYLIVSTTDPVTAFSWYRARIEPLEGGGSFVHPEARKFVLVPDDGRAGLVRLSNEKHLDNVLVRSVGEARDEFEDFLKVREQLMRTSVYSREK